MRQSVYLLTALALVTAIVVVAWLALHQRAPDAGSSQVSPVADPQYESAHDLQSLPIERTAPTQGTAVGNEELSALGQSPINTNVNELEPGPGEHQSPLRVTDEQLDLTAPGAGYDDVDVTGPGPGEGQYYDDPLDAGPGANDIDIGGPGPGDSDPGIDGPGPGEHIPTP